MDQTPTNIWISQTPTGIQINWTPTSIRINWTLTSIQINQARTSIQINWTLTSILLVEGSRLQKSNGWCPWGRSSLWHFFAGVEHLLKQVCN